MFFEILSWRKHTIKATGEIGGIVIGKTERAGGGFGGRAQDLPMREIRRSKNDIFLTGGSTEVKRERLATRRGCRNYERRGRLPGVRPRDGSAGLSGYATDVRIAGPHSRILPP